MIVFDIETDNLYEDVTTLWCLTLYNTDTEEYYQYSEDRVIEGVKYLWKTWNDGNTLCGHNIINYDLPVLHKLYPWFRVDNPELQSRTVDTLVLSRLILTHLEDTDAPLLRNGTLPKRLYKSHSLKAWGYRLGELKGTYGEQDEAWSHYTPEMLEYNKQDVVVTSLLYEYLHPREYSETSTILEHQIAWLMSKQEKNGFPFDIEKAHALEATLRCRAGEILAQLVGILPDYPDKIVIPKRDNKKKGYKAGVPIQRYKPFNTNSRQQIEWLVRKYYGYEPSNPECYDVPDEETPLCDCRLKIDDATIPEMKNDPKAPEELRKVLGMLEEMLLVNKRLGQLADGKNAWLSMVGKDGRMHGAINPNGAVSGRATHSRPNVAQVPHVGSPYGAECRELFKSGDWYQVGVDACGLELRCLAHFMAPYDNGEYGQIILNGDIHTHNQKAAGLATRNQAKTFVYATLYGAGDAKIGKITGGDAAEGKALKKRFAKAVPAWGKLKQAVEDALAYPPTFRNGVRKQKWKRHYLLGLDKRHLYVRSLHSALNLLLQSAGALICKKWMVRVEERLRARGLKHGWDGDYALMMWCHDEGQWACRTKEIAEIVVEEAQLAMRDAQEFFHFRMQLDTEGKIGKNWMDCH